MSATVRKIVVIEKNLPVQSISSSIDFSGGKVTIDGRDKF